MRAIVVLLACLLLGGLSADSEAGLARKLAKATVKEFNQEPRTVREDHLLLPINYVEHKGQTYAYHIPRRFARLAWEGETFRIRKFKTKSRHVLLELETLSKARMKIAIYDNKELSQELLDEILPLVLAEVFAFGVPPPRVAYVGHRESRLVHIGSCNHLPSMAQREEFGDLKEAEAAGYQRCTICFSRQVVLPLEGYSNARVAALERARLFELAFPAVEDSATQRMVHELGERVLSDYPLDLVGFEYTFKVVRSEVPQAISFPTGFIFITDRLLAAIEDPIELEFVLAHEIAHCELHLPPIGYDIPLSGTIPVLESRMEQMRFRETVADLIAMLYIRGSTEDDAAVASALSILRKLQYAHEALPVTESEWYDTHPTYTARLELFDDQCFMPANPTKIYDLRPFEDESVFQVRVLGKSRTDSGTFIYLLIEGTDLVNKEWKIFPNTRIAKISHEEGRSRDLHVQDHSYAIGSEDVAVVKARAGTELAYDKIDLSRVAIEFGSAYWSDDEF